MFTTDSRTETFLTQMGVKFNYKNDIPFARLKPGWDKENIGRPVAMREDAVMEYASLMDAGSPAPAPITHGSDSLGCLDGVQRLAAAQLNGYTHFASYVVECDSENTTAAIRVLANARLQGRPESAEWTRRRAVEVLVVQRGLSIREVAKMGGWQPSQVEATAKAIEWATAIESIGGPKLPDNMLQSISDLTTREELAQCPEVITGFLEGIKQAKFSNGDASPYFQTFFAPITKRSRRTAIYKQRLQDFKEDAEVQARLTGRKSPGLAKDVVMLRSLRSAESTLDEILSSGEDVPFVDEFFRVLRSIEKKLKRLAKHHPQQESVRVPADMYSERV